MDESVYQYRYETHCHTSWCSGCGQDSPQDMAAAYYHMGYAGIVITDHFLRGNSCVDRNLPWADQMGRYFQACQAAAQWAKGKDFDVLFGIEHCYGNGKEVLTYGITLEFLVANPDIHLLPIHQYADLGLSLPGPSLPAKVLYYPWPSASAPAYGCLGGI